ncbi:MAG: hypothetical protein KDB46_05065 [Solirubrobacterales bacterium]|nr:hypothetical protein [Solirubrobacterales bacterium]
MNTMTTSRFARIATLFGALVALVVAVAPASGNGGSGYFGSDLNKNVQPSNAGPAHKCDYQPGKQCTWVLNEAYGAPGREGAPHSGYIKKLRLIAQEAGHFKLQVVKLNNLGDVILKQKGPRIDYEGQQGYGGPVGTYRVEKFKVHVPVHKGEYLAIKARETSTLRCSSGGDNNLQLSPALKKVGEKRTWDAEDGCWMLLEAKVK